MATAGLPRRAALYARVSTRNGQTPENQVRALAEVANRAGWQIVETYIDYGISGAKGRDKRPAFDRLLKDAARRKFGVIMAWSVDRLGRSLQDLVGFLGEIHANGIDLYLDRQGIDTTTPGGKAMFQMMGVFAEFEREIMRERICAGLDRARAKGKKLGNPGIPEAIERAVVERLTTGAPKRQIARELGIDAATVRRIERRRRAGT
jgi:DNA invertase Pin-like site-specific DNA recombinase